LTQAIIGLWIDANHELCLNEAATHVAARHESKPAEHRLLLDVAPARKNSSNPDCQLLVVSHCDYAFGPR